MKRLARDDPRAQHMSANRPVDREGLARFVADKHHWVLATARADGRPQLSLVTGGMTADGVLAIASYPERAKVANSRRNPEVSVLVMGEAFNDEWVQIDGTARVLDGAQALDGFVAYYRCISGEHPDWDEYRQAMDDQGKALIEIEPTRWGPVSKGGFPPSMFDDE